MSLPSQVDPEGVKASFEGGAGEWDEERWKNVGAGASKRYTVYSWNQPSVGHA